MLYSDAAENNQIDHIDPLTNSAVDGSRWKEIWQNRDVSHAHESDTDEMFAELKRLDGFDIQGTPIDGFKKQHSEIMAKLSERREISSVFDLGCGSGANMLLLKDAGYSIGGMDYSQPLIRVADEVLGSSCLELICGEAKDMPTDVHYDAIISNSVFSYFPSLDYARAVLDKMAVKADAFAIIDVHEHGMEDDFKAFRRSIDPDYDEKYKGLDKLFYPMSFFEMWALDNGFQCLIEHPHVEGYWNNRFVFTAYMWKKQRNH